MYETGANTDPQDVALNTTITTMSTIELILTTLEFLMPSILLCTYMLRLRCVSASLTQ